MSADPLFVLCSAALDLTQSGGAFRCACPRMILVIRLQDSVGLNLASQASSFADEFSGDVVGACDVIPEGYIAKAFADTIDGRLAGKAVVRPVPIAEARPLREAVREFGIVNRDDRAERVQGGALGVARWACSTLP